MAFPAIFLIIGIGLEKLAGYLKKYHKYLGVIVVGLLLIFGGYQMFTNANLIIKNKVGSYSDLKNVGEWLNKNSFPGEAILSGALPQMTYYSERAVFPNAGNLTAELDLIREKNVRYVVLTNWEKDPPWAFSYFSEPNEFFNPVFQSVTDYGENKMFVVVFEVKK